MNHIIPLSRRTNISLPDDAGNIVLFVPNTSLSNGDGNIKLKREVIQLVMAFRALIITAIERKNFNILGHSLADMARLYLKEIPSMRELMIEILRRMEKEKKEKPEDYQLGVGVCMEMLANVFNQVYDIPEEEEDGERDKI